MVLVPYTSTAICRPLAPSKRPGCSSAASAREPTSAPSAAPTTMRHRVGSGIASTLARGPFRLWRPYTQPPTAKAATSKRPWTGSGIGWAGGTREDTASGAEGYAPGAGLAASA